MGGSHSKGNEIFEWQQDLELAQVTKKVKGKWLVQNVFLAQRSMLKAKLSITKGGLLKRLLIDWRHGLQQKICSCCEDELH